MPFSVFDILDQIFINMFSAWVSFRKYIIEQFQDCLHNLDISALIMSANIISLTQSALFLYHIDSLSMIFYIQPVSDIESISINRNFLSVQSIIDDQWNQFLRKLIWSIVVTAICNIGRELISINISLYQHV